MLPEDKFALVEAFQRAGHVVGMCGDGANDAPALRQAQMGIAVSTATDVAKAAAGMVLTEPGLGGMVSCGVASVEISAATGLRRCVRQVDSAIRIATRPRLQSPAAPPPPPNTAAGR